MIKHLLTDFKWNFKTKHSINDHQLIIHATPQSDYFIDPLSNTKTLNAPFFHTDISGDFVLSAKVTPEFNSVYDAGALMIMSGDTCWVKFCFEYTDIGTHAIVSVVTNGVADDANGVDIPGPSVYLQLAKKNQAFALHYSTDGKEFKMSRFFTLPVNEPFKVGFVVQSPCGETCKCYFEDIRFEPISLADLRKGI